jgi:hypothetical protein
MGNFLWCSCVSLFMLCRILRRNCLLKHVIEGKLEGRIEMTERRGRRRKQLLDDLKEKRRYWKLKEEALDRTLWRTRLGRGCGPVVRDYRMNVGCLLCFQWFHLYGLFAGYAGHCLN